MKSIIRRIIEYLKSEPVDVRKTIDGIEYEISDFNGGQRYYVEPDGTRGNPAHTPERGRNCGCSGCDGCLGGP